MCLPVHHRVWGLHLKVAPAIPETPRPLNFSALLTHPQENTPRQPPGWESRVLSAAQRLTDLARAVDV